MPIAGTYDIIVAGSGSAGVTVLLYTFVCGVVMDGNRITGVITESKSGRQVFSAKAFIEVPGMGMWLPLQGFPIIYDAGPNEQWNDESSPNSKYYFSKQDSIKLSVTLETPYFGLTNTQVSQPDLLELWHAFARAVVRYIKKNKKFLLTGIFSPAFGKDSFA